MKRIIFTYCQIIAALLLFVSSAHAITWEDRGGEAIRLGVVTATTATPSGTYYSVTENGVIAESRDGGMTWEPVSLPQPGIHFNAVKFFDDTHGIAVGDGYLAYLNGGTSWQVVSRLGCKMNAVDMSDAHTAHIACDGSILVFSLNTGNFSKTSVESTNYSSVSFHGGVGYACGDGGRVAKYTDGEWKLLNNPDGGYDWVKYVLRTSGALTHIVASDRQTAYAMTDDGRLIKTIDGGLSWSERESGTGKGISSMSLIPGGDIAITGDGGRSYRLSDGTDRYSVRYYYDELGRIAASQTSRQQAMTPQRYSYISYDAMGRTVEAGEIEAQTPPTQTLMRSPEYPGNWGTRREQVVHTFYDKPQYAGVTARFEEGVQENLRNRISSVIYMDEYDSEMLRYDHATHYSYDIHGNVKELLQEDRKLAAYGDEYAFHSIRYDYDLISGNVNEVHYQNGQPDQFGMYYEYDSENRIQTVKSRFPNEQPKQDASYEYYRHGPLARTVLGEGVQGMDYAYTLQGWVKGMNSDELGNDMGCDGNDKVARDVVGYTLGYNSNDYKPIAIPKGQTESFYKAVSEQNMTDLYTGNISRMATALANPESGANFGTQVRDFRYDVLNRLKSSKVVNSKISADAHATTYSYDDNGNITELTRNNANGDNFDKLTYRYEQDAEGNFINNRLLHVNDNTKNPNALANDIKDQGVYAQNEPAKRNYAYDQQGNLISDKAEEIASIEWTATGKVRRITRTAQSIKPDLEFRYDALGNRVSKTVISKDGNRTTTYYVRDAKGTTLATYTESDGELRLSEQHLYGAKRLGMRSSNLLVASTKGDNTNPENNSGEKRYELTNHLGNVLAVVSGEKKDGSAQILSMTDYYPFGMEMDGRKYVKLTADGTYRYGFTGHEKEFDLANGVYTTDYRLLDARIGRWLSVDPLADKYAGMSPYNYCEGNPVILVDPNGTSTHTSDDGTVVAIYDDDDLGVYKHPAEDLNGFDKNTMLVNGEPLPNDITKWMGETWTPFGFANFKEYEDHGIIVPDATAKIDYNSNWATEKMSDLRKKDPNFVVYAIYARGKAKWDFKFHTPLNTPDDDGEKGYPGYGSNLYGKFASARDLGNFGAGVVAARSTLPKSFFDYGYGSYNACGNSMPKTAFSVFMDVNMITYGQNQDYLMYNQNYIDPVSASFVQQAGWKHIEAMEHGEDKLSQMGIDTGYYFEKNQGASGGGGGR